MKSYHNTATRNMPRWRTRYHSPLTLSITRNCQITEQSLRRTPLDKMLTTTQADNLERYVLCEQWLNGSARSTDYSGDRVQSGRVNMYPIPDNRLPLLAMHARNKARVSKHHLIILDAFIAQQLGLPGARTDAQLGLTLDPSTRNAALTWRRAVVEAADALGTA